jgi:hypothetical protein
MIQEHQDTQVGGKQSRIDGAELVQVKTLESWRAEFA